jgi:hypothetical protein
MYSLGEYINCKMACNLDIKQSKFSEGAVCTVNTHIFKLLKQICKEQISMFCSSQYLTKLIFEKFKLL